MMLAGSRLRVMCRRTLWALLDACGGTTVRRANALSIRMRAGWYALTVGRRPELNVNAADLVAVVGVGV